MTESGKTHKRYIYEKAPLQEAIFEARFWDDNYDLTLPGRFFDRISTKFPHKKEIQNTAITISAYPLTTNQPPKIQAPVIQAWNNQHNSCLQIGPGIVALNDLNYLNWETFSKNIITLLDGYFECTAPSATQRIGFRCVNRFLIPNDNIILSDYFRLGFALPNELSNPKGLGLNISQEVPFRDKMISVVVRFHYDSLRESEKGVAVVLDIDSFVTDDIGIDKNKILHCASDCHDLEKTIFESLLQDKMREILGAKEA